MVYSYFCDLNVKSLKISHKTPSFPCISTYMHDQILSSEYAQIVNSGYVTDPYNIHKKINFLKDRSKGGNVRISMYKEVYMEYFQVLVINTGRSLCLNDLKCAQLEMFFHQLWHWTVNKIFVGWTSLQTSCRTKCFTITGSTNTHRVPYKRWRKEIVHMHMHMV